MKKWLIIIVSVLLLGFSGQNASATLILNTIGEQDFADGTTPILASTAAAAGVGEPYPFDGTIFGSDPGGTLGSFSYTHIFLLNGLTPITGNLTIGLIDHDSFTMYQDTIDIYFDGIKQDDSAFLGISTAPSSVSVVTLPVDIALLLDGALTVSIFATQAAQGFSGNSIAGDFSTLKIETSSVPEPSTLLLLGYGLLGFGFFARKRIKV